MTLGEFRELTQNMPADAKITISIDIKGWVNPCSRYDVNNSKFEYDSNPFDAPTSINLICEER